MAMPLPTPPLTADDLLDAPDDGNRYEIVRGEVFVMPAPSRFHQRAVVALLDELHSYVARSAYEALASPLAVRAAWNTQVEPDVIVAPRELDHEGGGTLGCGCAACHSRPRCSRRAPRLVTAR